MGERPTPRDNGLDESTELRSSIELHGVDWLAVDDLTPADVESLDWSGSPTHLKSVSEALDRVPSGEVEYLAIRAPDGLPIAKAGIDYSKYEDGAELWQLATDANLERLGLATRLIRAAEDRIRARGRRYGYVRVEEENPGARRLYERLDYEEIGRETDSWNQEDERGNIYRYETEVAVMRKDLTLEPVT